MTAHPKCIDGMICSAAAFCHTVIPITVYVDRTPLKGDCLGSHDHMLALLPTDGSKITTVRIEEIAHLDVVGCPNQTMAHAT